jgi:UDP-glucose 4-epimerase
MKKQYKDAISGKTILITGGTGSFGNSVIQSLLPLNPKKIIVFSRDEKKQHDMRMTFQSEKLRFILGDVRSRESVDQAMDSVDLVFHAAALKQVPSCEFFPIEAVRTNILGAQNVIDSAVEHGVSRLVVLSTDKAVYPINAMGMSKALMEKVMIAKAREMIEYGEKKTTLCGVRYGNVMYSRGSVIPHFVEQIKKGEPLTITNKHMTRFLLPLRDAVDLVLYALINGKNGDIYVRKAPAATIETLALAMCALFQYKKGVRAVGIRAGEKMHETLVTSEELARAVDQGDYFRIPPESQKLDYQQYFSEGKNVRDLPLPYTSENTKRLSLKETIKLLKTLPEIKKILARL